MPPPPAVPAPPAANVPPAAEPPTQVASAAVTQATAPPVAEAKVGTALEPSPFSARGGSTEGRRGRAGARKEKERAADQQVAAVPPPAAVAPPEIPAVEAEPPPPPPQVIDTGRSPAGTPSVALRFLQWSVDPARRYALVSIDGAPSQRLREGESAGSLTVSQIMQTGVQFKVEGKVFTIRSRH
jgi:hypothetical protein